MDPAPLCKTAILSFIIDETLLKFWNVSSISRKRAQMVVEDKQIIVNEYNEKALKINGWVKIGKQGKDVKRIDDIKKGVSNYYIETKEQVDRLISLNKKLICYELYFNAKKALEIDYIEHLSIDFDNYDFYSKCSLNKVYFLNLNRLSFIQIEHIIPKFKKIDWLKIEGCSISNFNLNSLKAHSLLFHNVIFSEKVDLPSNLDFLRVFQCENVSFLSPKEVNQIQFYKKQFQPEDSFNVINKCKRLKIAEINVQLSECINYLPSTIRELECSCEIENIDLTNLKSKFPFLIRVIGKIPIEIAQALNLRTIDPIINEIEEKLTFRPREIDVDDENIEQLNKRPELFEKVKKIKIDCNNFNFDCLPGKIKQLEFGYFSIEGRKFESFEKNSWKFEESIIYLLTFPEDQTRIILNSLKKVWKIKILEKLKHLVKDYPHLKFTF